MHTHYFHNKGGDISHVSSKAYTQSTITLIMSVILNVRKSLIASCWTRLVFVNLQWSNTQLVPLGVIRLPQRHVDHLVGCIDNYMDYFRLDQVANMNLHVRPFK